MIASDLHTLRYMVVQDLETAKACLAEVRYRKSFIAGVRAGQCRSLETVLKYIDTLTAEGGER